MVGCFWNIVAGHQVWIAEPGRLAGPAGPAGAAVAGLWVGLLLYVLPSWSVLVAAQADSITGIIGLVGAVIMVGGGLFLEHCCRAPGIDR